MIKLKVLKDSWEKAKGFQKLKEPEEDEGLLFVFPVEKILSFHMRNVKFDLDIIFLDENGHVKCFQTMKSNSKKIYKSCKPCKFAIELKKGSVKKLKIKEGMKLKFKEI